MFADPSRRSDGRRHIAPDDYTPPLSALRAKWPIGFPLAVKIAPGVAWRHIECLGAEAEFVSVEGELKECVLWFGPLRTAARRATILPAGISLSAEETGELPPIHPVAAFLFDPDPSIVRADLTAPLAEQLQLFPIDHTVMMLTGPEVVSVAVCDDLSRGTYGSCPHGAVANASPRTWGGSDYDREARIAC